MKASRGIGSQQNQLRTVHKTVNSNRTFLRTVDENDDPLVTETNTRDFIMQTRFG